MKKNLKSGDLIMRIVIIKSKENIKLKNIHPKNNEDVMYELDNRTLNSQNGIQKLW